MRRLQNTTLTSGGLVDPRNVPSEPEALRPRPEEGTFESNGEEAKPQRDADEEVQPAVQGMVDPRMSAPGPDTDALPAPIPDPPDPAPPPVPPAPDPASPKDPPGPS